ncbi:hypothetical protein L798_07931 [Zootermopsis nevadensis]|uniref:Uncharacterized protein n=1 Tax=Zootermopsis nevadensis TaxID=136037 RepID=A0A067RJJ7_ZOONE|nr:hypothetical protein L798_07931 [Zootermopsis nevadensis]
MPCAQIEHFSEPGSLAASSAVVETAVVPSNKSVDTAEESESTEGLQQVTVCSESTTHESKDSLRDFIANMFHNLKDSQAKDEYDNAKLSKELNKKIQNIEENIRLENEKLIAKFEHEKLSKELSGRLESETARLHANIKQVRDNADKEFSGVKDRFNSLVSQVNE